jgi:hypothetical protein
MGRGPIVDPRFMHPWARLSRLRAHHLDYLALCLSFGRHLCLGIDVQCRLRRTVPQWLLHHLHILAIGLQKRGVDATKRVPADPLVDAETLHHRLNVVTHHGRHFAPPFFKGFRAVFFAGFFFAALLGDSYGPWLVCTAKAPWCWSHELPTTMS